MSEVYHGANIRIYPAKHRRDASQKPKTAQPTVAFLSIHGISSSGPRMLEGGISFDLSDPEEEALACCAICTGADDKPKQPLGLALW